MNRLSSLLAAALVASLSAGASAQVPDGGGGSDGGEPRLQDGSTVNPGLSTSLGAECQSDADCLPGLFCVTSDDDQVFGAGPPGGVCVADCSLDASACAAFDAFCVTVGGLETPGDPRDDNSVCLPACENDTITRDKCQGRLDMMCVPSSQPPLGFCQPVCGSDFDCPTDRVCDLGIGLCVPPSELSTGAGVGSECAVDEQCQGLCIGYQSIDFSFCTAYCSVGALSTCGAEPTSTGQLDAYCLPLFGPRALGDIGACLEVCTCNEECSHPGAVCYPIDDPFLRDRVPGLCDARSPGLDGGAGVPCGPSAGGAGPGDAGGEAGSGNAGGEAGGSVTMDSGLDSGGGSSTDDAGCGCRTKSSVPSERGALAALGVLLAAAARRRRRGETVTTVQPA